MGKKPSGGASAGPKKINLALQGGGAHGAFAWGVIDRLLEEGNIEVEGIVGTSAGAMNAAVTACGLAFGGNEGARQKLTEFWKKISEAAAKSMLRPTIWDKLMGPGNMDMSPGWIMSDALSRIFSPYQMNPMNLNPLKDVLTSVIDFPAMHRERRVKLFVCASNVMTGKIKVFDQHNVTVEAVLASACLPFMFQAVEINGEYFWDGGYMGNPPLYPLIYHTDTRDVLIVQLNPINIPKLPNTAQEILDRINTLSFNSSLMREIRVINFVTKLIDGGFDDGGRLKRILIHTIDGEDVLSRMGVSSKINADWDWLMYLHALGRERAEQFMHEHYDKLGRESSTNVEEKFL